MLLFNIYCVVIQLHIITESLAYRGWMNVVSTHSVRDVVDGKSSCIVIHVHLYSGGKCVYRFSLYVTVPKWKWEQETSQTPWLVVVSKLPTKGKVFSSDPFIWDWLWHTIPIFLRNNVHIYSNCVFFNTLLWFHTFIVV